MALPFQGMSKSDIETGIIAQIEIAYQAGSPSYVNAGDVERCAVTANVLSMRADPSDTDLPYAFEFTVDFALVQTDASAEIASMTSTSGTGVYRQAVQLKLTYVTGRVLTLGSDSDYPLYLLLNYSNGDAQGSQRIEGSGRTIEPITSFPGKVS